MEITANENSEILLKKVYEPVVFETEDGEIMVVWMRDTGFEFTYEGKLYEAQQGKIKQKDQ